MPRKPRPITCKESDLISLRSMAQNELCPQRVQERANMILNLLDGKSIKDVAADYKTSKSVVSLWRDRFSSEGVSGLYDQERPGRGGDANKGVHEKVVARINEHSASDPPLSARNLAEEFGVSESTIFRILEQEDISLSRQRKWYVGFTQAPQAKSTDMVGLYISSTSRIMVVCTNRNGLLPQVQGVLRTKNRGLAEALSVTSSDGHLDLIDLLQSAKEHRKLDRTRHTRFDGNQFLETAFDSLLVDDGYDYTIFIYQEKEHPLTVTLPTIHVRLRKMDNVSLWNENASMVFDLLNAPNQEERTGADLISAIDDFVADYSDVSEPFSWIKRMARPDDPVPDKKSTQERQKTQTKARTDIPDGDDVRASYAKCTFEIIINGQKFVFMQQVKCDLPTPEEFCLSTKQFYKDFEKLEELSIQWTKQAKGCVIEYLKACAETQGVSGKYKERQIEAEIGRVPVIVYGELLSGLRGKESLKSISFRHTVGFLIRTISYRQTTDVINLLTHRNEEEWISYRTINDIVKNDFSEAEEIIDGFAKETLEEHGFSGKTGKLRQGNEYPEVFQGSPQNEQEKAIIEQEAIDFVERYNSKQEDDACKIDLSKWTSILDEVGCPTVAVSPDGVEGKHQKTHRMNKATNYEGEKGGKTVNTSNVHLEVGGKVLAFCARTMKQAFLLLLAVLLFNDLFAAYQLVIFTDGGRDIKKWTYSILGFANPILVIDWFHLKKKCNEYFSMALKGGAQHKDARGKIKREFFARLWVGNLKGAIAYLDTIDKSMIKNHRRLYEMKEYLERKRYGITCYALRRHFKLRLSSNKVEKLNDINTSSRQKHKGKAWSHDGSYLLTLLSTIFYNGNEKEWYSEGKLNFSPKDMESGLADAA